MNNIPWYVARKGIHIGYAYIDQEPTQFGFICEIDTEDLEELKDYAVLQRHYEEEAVEFLDWSDIVKLILIELDFRNAKMV